MKIQCSAYHNETFRPQSLASRVKRVAKNLVKLRKKLKFDAIAFRGSSGSSLAFPVSVMTGIDLIYVRKEKQHHGMPVEGTSKNVRRYIILDDFISRGDTMRSILGAINHLNKDEYDEKEHAHCVGIALWDVCRADHIFEYKRKYITLYKV